MQNSGTAAWLHSLIEDDASHPVLLVDGEGRVSLSPAFARLIGPLCATASSPDDDLELAGHPGTDNASRLRSALAELRNRDTTRCTLESIADDSSIILELCKFPNGMVAGILSPDTDPVTSARAISQRDMLARALNVLPLEISIKCAYSRRYIYFNKSSVVPGDLLRNDPIGKMPEEFLPPDIAATIRAEDDHLLTAGRTTMTNLVEKDGQVYCSTRQLLLDEDGQPEYIIACSENASDLINAARARDLSSTILYRAEVLARQGSAYVNLVRNRVHASPNLRNLLDMGPSETLDDLSAIFSVFRGPSAVRLHDITRLAIEVGPQPSFDVDMIRRDGAAIHFEVSFNVDRKDSGEPEGLHIIFHDMTDRRLAEADVRHLAFFDQLTQLPNRTRFSEIVENAIISRAIDNAPIAIALVDLDGFKSINDRHGHQMGDKVLQIFAERLSGTLKRRDLPARLGGDEFGVFLESCATEDHVRITCERIVARAGEPFIIDGHTLRIGASVGYTMLRAASTSLDDLIFHADRALYRCKGAGKSCAAGIVNLDDAKAPATAPERHDG